MEVIVIETRQLGDRSYLVHDGSVALAIDPQRDIDRIEAAADRALPYLRAVPAPVRPAAF